MKDENPNPCAKRSPHSKPTDQNDVSTVLLRDSIFEEEQRIRSGGARWLRSWAGLTLWVLSPSFGHIVQ